ncbi:MAG: glycosyltransferase family 2 protein [Pseudomonadota bacterium]
MSHVWSWLFWGSVGTVAYTYLVYPALLFLFHLVAGGWDDLEYLIRRKKRRVSDQEGFSPDRLPHVSFVTAAHNEEGVLTKKIENTLGLDYPSDRMELLIGSDASGDRTVEIVRQSSDSRVRVFDYTERSGKIGVLKKLVPEAKGEILVFSDANTFFENDSLKKLIRHFCDPEVGVVCGELRLTASDGTLQNEGAYWRFETILKMLESRFGAVLGANGGIYAVRRKLFPEIPGDTIIEDFVIPLLIRGKGYRTSFDPEAVALERNPVDPRGEFRRRVRIGTGCAQAMPLIRHLLSPRFGMLAFSLWSHKVVRWAVPFTLLLAMGANLALLSEAGRCPCHPYVVTLSLQILFYALAVMGWLRNRWNKPLWIFGLPFLFVAMNAALLTGFLRFWLGLHQVAWKPTARTVDG